MLTYEKDTGNSRYLGLRINCQNRQKLKDKHDEQQKINRCE